MTDFFDPSSSPAYEQSLGMTETLGKYLRHKRESANLTQFEVASQLGYSSPQFISNIERGVSAVPVKSLKRMITLYGLSADEVIEMIVSEKRASLKRTLLGISAK